MYVAVKRFKHAVEGRNFVIFTDHKPLTYAFDQKLDKCSPRQFRYLDYIGQFTTDIRYIKGQKTLAARRFQLITWIIPSGNTRTYTKPGDDTLCLVVNK
jgi:hypothetical protein